MLIKEFFIIGELSQENKRETSNKLRKYTNKFEVAKKNIDISIFS